MNVVCMKSTALTDLDIPCDIRYNGSSFPSYFFFKQQNKRNDCWPVKVLVSPIGVEGLF